MCKMDRTNGAGIVSNMVVEKSFIIHIPNDAAIEFIYGDKMDYNIINYSKL